MEKVRISSLFVVVLHICLASVSAFGVDPISHWEFDEGTGSTAYDSAGGNHGTIHGANWTTGQIDGALDFDGENDYVDFGDIDEFEFGDANFSISAWFYAKGTHDLGGDNSGAGIVVCKYNYTDNGRQWYFKHEEAGYIDFYTNPTGTTGEHLRSLLNSYENQWVHVVGVRNGQTKFLYINGVLDNTGPTEGVVTGKSSKVLVGATEDATHQYKLFNGVIDDVRVYDRALSEEEIQELYPGELAVSIDIKPGSCPNPLNLTSKGVLPVAILGTEDFDVDSIDAVSVRLAGVDPIRSAYEDVAGPVSDGNECECTEEDADGYIDLTLKFKTPEIVEALVNIYGDLVDDEVLALSLTGVLTDGTPIEGTDCVRIVGKVPRALAAKRSDINEDGMVNMSDFGMMAEYWLERTTFEYQD